MRTRAYVCGLVCARVYKLSLLVTIRPTGWVSRRICSVPSRGFVGDRVPHDRDGSQTGNNLDNGTNSDVRCGDYGNVGDGDDEDDAD